MKTADEWGDELYGSDLAESIGAVEAIRQEQREACAKVVGSVISHISHYLQFDPNDLFPLPILDQVLSAGKEGGGENSE